jgi:O-antigen/teichoic acid export membrane protein
LLKSIAVLAGGRTGVASLTFARNILVARLIPVEDYGIASTFVIALAFIELIGDLALDRMVVQDREGGNRRFVGVIQTLMLARGALLAGLLFALAGPIAAVFNHPELTWAYQVFAVAPLLRSLNNLDVVRMQRQMAFGPQIKAELTGAAVSLAALWPLTLWLGDFRVMLVALIGDHLIRCLMTQVLAERRFALAWDGAIVRRAIRFGLPLLFSGMLAFIALQGDRVLVGNRFTAVDLGLFSAAVTLAMTPCLIAARIAQTFFLPLLARVQDDQARFDAQAALTLQTMLCLGAGAAFAFALVGPLLFDIAFGDKMAAGRVYVVPIGIAYAVLLARSGSMQPVALARGFTLNPLLGNLVRLVSLPVAFLLVQRGGGILDIILVGIVAELAALALTASLLRFKVKVLAPARLLPGYLLGLALVGALVLPLITDRTGDWLLPVQAGLLLGVLAACGDLRRALLSRLQTKRGRLK